MDEQLHRGLECQVLPIYLLTLTASAVTMAVVSAVFLVRLVVVSGLYQETYVDDLGHLQVMDTIFLIQVINYSGNYVVGCVLLTLGFRIRKRILVFPVKA